MGAIWACLAAKLTSSGAMLEVEGNSVALECCNCEERSTASDSPRLKEPPPKENTDVTAIPSDLQSTPRTVPPAELFQGTAAASEVTVVKINV